MTPPAIRAIRVGLPESVVSAVIEFVTGSLIAAPTRVGKPLRADLTGIYSARRGTYRVLYRINGSRHEVIVLGIDHRRDVYRT
ncbi:MAG: type II toxin-antitoxin system RelE/ParE family toxin [Micrococcales bacterium]|nr:type II toxin-antitoxin system RelE/ParE family toxin [Micrococcales bacterium]